MSKNFSKIVAITFALAMCISLFGCGKKNTDIDANSGGPSVANTLYVSSSEDGVKTVVGKDGNPVKGYALDDAGNIVDEHGEIVVKAAQVVAFVPVKADESSKSPESSDSNFKSEENTTGSDNSEKPSSEDSGASSGSSNSGGGSSSNSSDSTSGGGSRPSGSGSGSSSNSGGSSGSSGGSSSSSGSGSSQPVHTHNWKPVYKTIEIPVYEQVCYTVCAACGQKFGINNTDDELDAHMIAHMKSGESSRTYEEYEDVQVGTQTVEALDHYECSCGATKEV